MIGESLFLKTPTDVESPMMVRLVDQGCFRDDPSENSGAIDVYWIPGMFEKSRDFVHYTTSSNGYLQSGAPQVMIRKLMISLSDAGHASKSQESEGPQSRHTSCHRSEWGWIVSALALVKSTRVHILSG